MDNRYIISSIACFELQARSLHLMYAQKPFAPCRLFRPPLPRHLDDFSHVFRLFSMPFDAPAYIHPQHPVQFFKLIRQFRPSSHPQQTPTIFLSFFSSLIFLPEDKGQQRFSTYIDIWCVLPKCVAVCDLSCLLFVHGEREKRRMCGPCGREGEGEGRREMHSPFYGMGRVWNGILLTVGLYEFRCGEE